MEAQAKQQLAQLAQWAQSFPQIGGVTKLIDIPTTVGTIAYALDKVIGTVVKIPAIRKVGGSGIISSLEIIQTQATPVIKAFLFNGSIANVTDNTLFAPNLMDTKKLIPLLQDGASLVFDTWEKVGANYVSSKININSPFVSEDNDDSIYLLLVAGGAITFTTVNDVFLRIGILLD